MDVTATRGEGGSMDEEKWPPATMGDVRTNELLRSLDVLGVKEHHFLEGPVDTDMDTGLDPVGEDQVRQIMEDVESRHGPHVRTGGDDGPRGASGRVQMGRRRFQPGREARRAICYHAVFPTSLGRGVAREARALRHLPPRHPNVVADEEIDLYFELPTELLDRKIASIKEHASQIEALYEVFGDEGFRRFMAKEGFVLAATKEP